MDDINQIKDTTPSLKKGSPQMFRNLRDKGMEMDFLNLSMDSNNENMFNFLAGIITYTEYLFLLSILTSKFESFSL